MGKRTQIQKEIAASGAGGKRSSPLMPLLVSAAVAACLTAIIFTASNRSRDPRTAAEPPSPPKANPAAETVKALLDSPNLPAGADIALLNLMVTPGLPADQGKKDKIIAAHLKTLDHWAKTVADQTWKNLHRYHANPQEHKSEAEWRLAMMCSILGQDFKLRYNPRLTSTERQNASNEEFFADPHSVFLTGCLGDSRIGTCASLPVLYVAIGRRIGYPMHLVAAKEHLFARWDDGKGMCVNLEAANGGGFSSYPDSHYRTWPKPLSPEEEKTGGYLRNLTAEESLAVFLTIRAACLTANGAAFPAIKSAAAAYRLAPELSGVSLALHSALTSAPHNQEAILMQELRQMEELRMHNMRTVDPMLMNPYLPHQRNPALPGQHQPGYPPHGFPHPDAMHQQNQTKYPGSQHGYQDPFSPR
jgi:hypothetical protein